GQCRARAARRRSPERCARLLPAGARRPAAMGLRFPAVDVALPARAVLRAGAARDRGPRARARAPGRCRAPVRAARGGGPRQSRAGLRTCDGARDARGPRRRCARHRARPRRRLARRVARPPRPDAGRAACARREAGEPALALLADAGRLFARLVEEGLVNPELDYERAMVLAMREDHDGAARAIERARADGWRAAWLARRDPTLAALRARGG